MTNVSPTWRFSKKGNPTMVVGNSRLSVFKTKSGSYKFVIGSVSDSNAEPLFGKDYDTQDDAKTAAMEQVKFL